jgi:hypothetical protein
MGTWASAAWDNDSAADWYADMFHATGLATYVAEALDRDIEEHRDEIRAAAYLLVALGRVYVWPIEDLEKHLALAITKLEAIKALETFKDSPDCVRAVDEEIAVLRSRLTKLHKS